VTSGLLFAVSSCWGSLLRFVGSDSVILFILDELEEGAKHEVMVPLGLEEHLGMSGVKILEESEVLPKTQSNAQPLELELEQLGIDLLVDQQVSWNVHHIHWVKRVIFFASLLLHLKSVVLPDLSLELLLKLSK